MGYKLALSMCEMSPTVPIQNFNAFCNIMYKGNNYTVPLILQTITLSYGMKKTT